MDAIEAAQAVTQAVESEHLPRQQAVAKARPTHVYIIPLHVKNMIISALTFYHEGTSRNIVCEEGGTQNLEGEAIK